MINYNQTFISRLIIQIHSFSFWIFSTEGHLITTNCSVLGNNQLILNHKILNHLNQEQRPIQFTNLLGLTWIGFFYAPYYNYDKVIFIVGPFLPNAKSIMNKPLCELSIYDTLVYCFSFVSLNFKWVSAQQDELTYNPPPSILRNIEISNVCIDYIKIHIFNSFKISDLKNVVHLSCNQIERIFYEVYQQTILQYIVSIKIEMAKNLLTLTNKSIKEIAYDLQYTPSHFSAVFHKFMSITPTQFRILYSKYLKKNN